MAEKEVCCEDVTVRPIGVIHSCFTEKFGIPRQPGMIKSATAQLELYHAFNREEMLRGLEQFSHIWVHFLFHDTVSEGWKPTIRPPWLGGKKRVGVFACRSPHRPNHMGLSAVRLERIVKQGQLFILELSGVDFLDKTPVLDIKPYVPYSDCLSTASSSYAHGNQPEVHVVFSAESKAFCSDYQQKNGRNLELLIQEMIKNDPRPASQKSSRQHFGMLLWDVNIRWRIEEELFFVEDCQLVGE